MEMKVEAVKKLNIEEYNRITFFPWLYHYYGKFLLNLATSLHQLNRPTVKMDAAVCRGS